jgi:hypothetical protein
MDGVAALVHQMRHRRLPRADTGLGRATCGAGEEGLDLRLQPRDVPRPQVMACGLADIRAVGGVVGCGQERIDGMSDSAGSP